MGSRDDSAAPTGGAAANPTPPAAAAAAAAAAQGLPLAPPPGWPSSSQAFYIHGGPAPFCPNPSASAYSWLGQHHNTFYHQRTMGPYPSPIAPPVYPHRAAFPPHAAVTASQMYIAVAKAGRREAGTEKKLEGFPEQIRDEDASNSFSESKGSSERTNTSAAHDDRELKKERRKQSNRESARRSRIRKQECEELAKRVRELNNESSSLTDELNQLNKSCDGLETLNSSMQEELISRYGPICCLYS